MRETASRTCGAFSGVSVSSVTATVRAVSSRYRRPAQVSPTVHTGPETAGTSTAMRSPVASPWLSTALTAMDSASSTASTSRWSLTRLRSVFIVPCSTFNSRHLRWAAPAVGNPLSQFNSVSCANLPRAAPPAVRSA